MLGTPLTETTVNDGGATQRRILDWPGVRAAFAKVEGYPAPFTLEYMKIGGIGGKSIRTDILTDFFNSMPVNVGRNRTIELRNEDDLTKFNTFQGYAGVSLVNLDLNAHAELLEKMPFDSRTNWPSSDKLPDGFDPIRLLEEGKNPGLGVRRLHEQGVNGRGVRIAIIDSNLLQNHREYAEQLVKYEEVG